MSELNGDRLMWCHLLMSEVLYCYRYTHVRDSSGSQLLALPGVFSLDGGQKARSFH